MSRCVVNYITGQGYYQRGQNRLNEGLKMFGNCDFISWNGPCPEGWPRHDQVPYGFKAMALQEAAKDHDLVLWCDSFVVPICSMEPLWERIKDDGYFLADGGLMNYEWTADSAYPYLFPGMPIRLARKINRTIRQIHAAVIGLNVRSEIGAKFLDLYHDLAVSTTAFCGPWANSNCPNHPVYSEGASYTTGPCGPPDVKGHRHDQTAASVLAWFLEMKLTMPPNPYAHNVPGEGTILLHDGPGIAFL